MPPKKKNTSRKVLISNEMNDNIIDILKKYLDKMDVTFNDKELSKKIYNILHSSLKESEKIIHDFTLQDIKSSSYSNLKPTQYMPHEFIDEIKRCLYYQYNITFQYKKIHFSVCICFDEKIQIEQYIKYIKWIICLCLQNITNEKEDSMYIQLFLTKMKKSIPGVFSNSIQPIHINSGYTSYPDKGMHICIYRKEEWMKVFIHECFHAFNMDFHEEHIHFPNLFEKTFHIKSTYLVCESFVEFWARVLNCAFFSYHLKPSMKANEFHDVFSLNLNIERIHSLLQASKMLNMFQLKYQDIISKERGNIARTIYKEETNAFCYYVITAIMMNFFDKTIQWFDLQNSHLFHFNKKDKQVVVFCHYIKQISKNPQLIQILNELNVCKIQKENYMKMTIFEIQFA